MSAALALAPRNPAADVAALPTATLLKLNLPERLQPVEISDLELALTDPHVGEVVETVHLVVHRRGQPFQAMVTLRLGDHAWAMTADTGRQVARRLSATGRPYAAVQLFRACDDAEAMAHTLTKGLS